MCSGPHRYHAGRREGRRQGLIQKICHISKMGNHYIQTQTVRQSAWAGPRPCSRYRYTHRVQSASSPTAPSRTPRKRTRCHGRCVKSRCRRWCSTAGKTHLVFGPHLTRRGGPCVLVRASKHDEPPRTRCRREVRKRPARYTKKATSRNGMRGHGETKKMDE